MTKRKFSKFRKAAIAALCAVSVTCTGLAAACSSTEEPDDTSSSKTQREDNQLLKNGNFEYFNVPEGAEHLIKNVSNWSRSGDSSGTMSGIIDTSETAWGKMTDPELKDKLEYNNDLSSSDPDYDDLHVDYNGMDTDDILYVDSYVAGFETDEDVSDTDDIIAIHGSYKDFLGIEGNDENGYTYRGKPVYKKVTENHDEVNSEFYLDEECTQPVRYALIDNPETHLGSYTEKDGKHYLGETEIFLDDDGYYYLDEDHNEPVGNVLMLHNYPTNRKYNGIEQHYTSQSITLEANTSAEISVWVKTADLKFDKGYFQINDENRGAYIEVTQTVASTTIDSFKIRAINTEKILSDKNLNLSEDVTNNNGWLKYTVYVNACDFASSTVTINLGLGDSNNSQKVTGYAFFDDVEVKKFIDLSDEGCTYSEHEEAIRDNQAYCALTSDEDDKIFIADREVRKGDSKRFSDCFHYLIDLASENNEGVGSKTPVPFDSGDLKATIALTTEESSGKIYASAETNGAKITGLTSNDKNGNYDLPSGMKDVGGRPTFNDLIGIYNHTKTSFTSGDFNNTDSGDGLAFRDLSGRLNPALTGEKGLQALNKFSYENGNMIVMLSAYGAAYTATFENNGDNSVFTVDGNKNEHSTNYKIISFWVKTSDMNGKTAATIKLVDADEKDNYASFTVDTTNVTTNVGDNKNIYNDWVQCFFFVHNDTDSEKQFKLEFSFGNISIASTSETSYNAGWVAMANMQTLDVTEDVFNLVSEGSYSKILSFTDLDEKTGNRFDTANGMTNVKSGVATPSNYNGVNGGSSYVTDKIFGDDYDRQNNYKNGITGLINRESFNDYDKDIALKIAKAFNPSITEATDAWNNVFGEDCYQPLIIVDSLRSYRDRAQANENNFTDYYILKDGNYVKVSELDEDEQVFDEDTTYYSAEQLVKNYGYIGATQSISSSSYKTISVKVLVSGNAEAYIYLVDPTTRDVLGYEVPGYTFNYDTEGNVLNAKYDSDWTEAEHRAAIVYTLRDDGLYEDKEGKVFANLYNLTTRFKYAKFEHDTFYEKTNSDEYVRVSYDDLKDGVLYYSDDKGTVASHYLCVEEQRVYEYDAATAKYYYMVNGKRDVEVNNFDPKLARYPVDDTAAPKYFVKVTADDCQGKWVTVNFVIHTGNKAKDYRLELWSGKREETGVTDGENTPVNGAVAFDYSSFNISESNYSNVLDSYTNKIIGVYQRLILEKDASKLTDDVTTFDDYARIIKELNISSELIVKELELVGISEFNPESDANYYTFTLYDSAQFVPFNKNTAESGQTGYDYSITDYSETLTYFRTRNLEDNSYNIFIDYSAIDQTVSIGSSNDSGSDNNTSDNNGNGGEGWLLITSIIFAVVMLFALAAVLVRFIWKKYSVKRNKKKLQKNNYKQRERYIRKLGLVKAAPIEEEPEATETPAEESAEETSVEETPAEEVPAEEAPAEEAPASDEDKKDE